MRLQLSFKSGKPVYLQIVDQVRSAAAAGAIKAGESLPSIRPLADFGATVVRVESAQRVDNIRTLGPMKDGQHGPDRDAIAGAQVVAAGPDRVDHGRDLVALDAREDVVAQVAVEEMDVRAAYAHDLGAQHDLARPGLTGLRHVDELHRALAPGDRRQHGRDPTRPGPLLDASTAIEGR